MSAAWPEGPARVTLPADGVHGQDVHVWGASLTPPSAAVDALETTLAEDERSRADRFHARRDRDHFVVARGVLRALLGRYLAMRPADLRFAYGPHGKPTLDAAATAGDLRFNLAHSGGVALYAIARGRALGVDVERHRSHEEDGLAERFFSSREIAALRALPPASRRAAFYTCWTRKEAYVKARGEGLGIPLDRFSVAFGPGESAALLHVEGDPQEAGRWSLTNLDVDEGYAAALCVEGPAGAVTCWRWS
jgi:4'-phosphopantetheinyl transferase